MKISSCLLGSCKNPISALCATSTLYHYQQKPLQVVDKRILDVGVSQQPPSAPVMGEKPTSQMRFFDNPISETVVGFEKSSSQTGSFEKPISETGFSVEPTSETEIPEEPISRTGYLENSTSETAFSGKPTSEIGFSEEPTSETEIPDRPISKTGYLENSTSETPFSGKPTSEIGFSEEPSSETEIPEKPISKTEYLENSTSETAFSGKPISETGFPDKPTLEQSSYHQFSSPLSEFPKGLTSRPPKSVLTQDSVVERLLKSRHDPISALKFFEWAEKQRGFVRGIDALCIMLHILVRSRKVSIAQKLLKQSISGSSCPSASILIDRLMESSKRCDSHPCVFDYVINCYVKAGRIEEALESFNKMVENDIFPGITSRNILLAALVRLNLTGMARKLYQEMQHRKVNCDYFTLDVMMNACLKEGKPDEAEECFREMKSRGFNLDSVAYTTVIQAVCEKPNSNKACELLNEMKGLGWVPSEITYTNVIKACMKQGNLQEALRLKDEVLSNGQQLNFGDCD